MVRKLYTQEEINEIIDQIFEDFELIEFFEEEPKKEKRA